MTDDQILPGKNNVVLFPKTHDFYQIELTRMLESERYGEAIALLRFLLQCGGEDNQIRTEWNALMQWLITAFPEAERGLPESGPWAEEVENSGETERDLLKQQIQQKLQADSQYIARLLASLTEGDMDDRKLLVLEHLAAAEDDSIDPPLLRMLEHDPLHPLLQFGILQTLRRRGIEGEVFFTRGQERVVVDIEATPLDLESYPPNAVAPAERVNEFAAVREPSLAYFASEMWQQFLKLIYGTSMYRGLCEGDEREADAWAAALHRIVARLLHIEEEEAEVKTIYGLTGELRISYERALRAITRSLSGE